MFELFPVNRRGGRFPAEPNWFDFDNDFFGKNSLEPFKTDIKDLEKSYVIEADLPGFKKEDISVSIEDKYLKIHAERNNSNDTEDKDKGYIRRERSYGSFERKFIVSEDVDTSGIAAAYENGVLSITLPKKECKCVEARKLEIK